MYLVFPLFLLVLFYGLSLEYLRRQWVQMKQADKSLDVTSYQEAQKITFKEKISLVVVARDEEKNLPALFNALLCQSLAAAHFEVHLIDDHSSDQTYALAEAFARQAPFSTSVHRLVLPKVGGSPKKAAIAQVLPLTSGNIIVVTDADCVPHRAWLAQIMQVWQATQPVFVSGPVRYVGERSLFEHMQALDFAALIGVGGSMLAAGRPGMCNAANMAFSKEAFRAVGGYAGNEEVPSGDDEFLLQKLAQRYPEQLLFLKSGEAVVSTSACSSWRQFLHQRRRWAGKWRLHKGLAPKALAIGVFLFYLLLAMAYVLPLFEPNLIFLLLPLLLLKAWADFRFLKEVLHLLKKPLPLRAFLIMEFVYPFYVLFFAVAANTGSFRWKERSYRYSLPGHE